MSEIIAFPGAPFARVEIERLFVKEEGVALPQPTFFVSLVDSDGCVAFGVFESTILSEAREAASNWSLPVVDKCRGAL